jgi:hypothetical protein
VATHGLHREPDEQCDEQGLQHAARGQRGDQRGRDDALEEVPGAARGVGLIGELRALFGSAGDIHSRTGFQQVADDQADGERDRRHHQEVAEREPTDLADVGGRAHRSDAEHDCAEDDRCDHHLDQVDEHRAERPDVLAESRRQPADQNSRDDGDDDG